jgi:hypothetical protein
MTNKVTKGYIDIRVYGKLEKSRKLNIIEGLQIPDNLGFYCINNSNTVH